MRQSVFLASLFLGAALSPLACAGAVPSSLLAVNFQDHAVLQRDQAIPLWGKAAPGARLTLLFDGKKTTAKADKNGRWQATLPAHGAGGPYTLSVSDAAGHSQNAADVMVGDNFLCSGQSNMEWPVHLAMQGDTDANAAGNPNIRLFRVQRAFSAAPQQDFTSHEQWEVTSPQSVRDFSAVCYYFGRALQPQIKVPVGLIYSAWGGSTIETWMGADALAKSGGYDGALKALKIYATSPEAAMADWHKSMLGWWQDHDPASAASPAWHDPAYDDSTWHEVVPAGPMRDLGAADLASFYGIVWLRTTVTVSEAQAKQGADLMLGPIDQVDTSWVNGKDVGSMEGWGTERTYHIAPGTLKAGANVIAVGFYGGDGLWGPAGARQLRFADGSAVAVGPRWRYHTSVEGYKAGRIPHAPWLKEIGQSVLYNAMIAPIGKVPLKGVLWYQGESNVGDDSYGR
ncbi:MAG: sialate O-acetylesterase, partial [Rhizomicrobium sp.]